MVNYNLVSYSVTVHLQAGQTGIKKRIILWLMYISTAKSLEEKGKKKDSI